jgi:hypothetical protein
MGRVVMSLRWGPSSARSSGNSTRARVGLLSACACLALLQTAGCGVDDRDLSAASGGRSSAGNSNGGGNSGQSFQSGGSGSTGVKASVPIPRCDYSQDVTPDCATLAKNPGLATDAADWGLAGGVYGFWDELDASESTSSGSLDVLNAFAGTDDGVADGAARQCLPATPGNAYDLAADAFVQDGQGKGVSPGDPYVGSAILGAFFFDDSSCQGTSIGFFNADPVTKTATWTHVSATGIAPDLTRAISVRLNAQKPFREFTFTATFDNVFVRER